MYPYLLPCLVSAGFNLLVFTISYIYLKETSPLLLQPTFIYNEGVIISESDPLISSEAAGGAGIHRRSDPDLEDPENELCGNKHLANRLVKGACLIGAGYVQKRMPILVTYSNIKVEYCFCTLFCLTSFFHCSPPQVPNMEQDFPWGLKALPRRCPLLGL